MFDLLALWLFFKKPEYFFLLFLVIIGILFATGFWGRYLKPAVNNPELTEAAENYIRKHMTAEDFYLEGEVSNIEISRVYISKQMKDEDIPIDGTIMVVIKGTYLVKNAAGIEKQKNFKVKHQMRYSNESGSYKVGYKRLPHIRYY